MANNGFAGVDVRQAGNVLLFRVKLDAAAGTLLTTGATSLRLYELQDDGTLKSFDWADYTFKTGALTTETLSMTHRTGNNGTFSTGIWTAVLATLSGFTSGAMYFAHVTNTGASPQSQAREFQYGGAEGGSATAIAETVAPAVWQESILGTGSPTAFDDPGSVGEFLLTLDHAASATPAEIADAVWAEDLPGAYTTGQAGYILPNISGGEGGDCPTAQEIATEVWTQSINGTGSPTNFDEPGTIGYYLLNELSGGDCPTVSQIAAGVWGEALPGAYTAGQAGYILPNIGGGSLTAQDIATEVWTQSINGTGSPTNFDEPGTIGYYLTALLKTETADEVWDTSLPGAYVAGEAGYILANISCPAVDEIAYAVWSALVTGTGTGSIEFFGTDSIGEFIVNSFDTLLAGTEAIQERTDNLPDDPADQSDLVVLLTELETAIDTLSTTITAALASIRLKTDLILFTSAGQAYLGRTRS